MARWIVHIQEKERSLETDEEKMRVDALLKRLGLRLEEYIVIRNGEVLTEKDWVCTSDKIELVRVISGG